MFSDDVDPGSCAGEFIITRTWTLTDDCNNTTTHVQTITVSDNLAPVVMSPDDVSLECSIDLPAAATTIGEYLALAGTSAADNCSDLGDLTVTHEDGVLSGTDCEGTITRTYYVTDDCGNTATVTHIFEVSDNTDPVVEAGVLEGCYNSVEEAEQAALEATSAMDNCTDPLELSYEVNTEEGMDCDSVITVTVYDGCGNSSFVTYETMINCQTIRLKVYLQGAYSLTGDSLRTTINNAHALPGQINASPFIFDTPAGHPYFGAPWNFTDFDGTNYGDGGGMTPYPIDVVDWILVQVREGGIGPAFTIWECVGWVHKDGNVTFPESCPYPTFDIMEDYYIVVQHRNHLGIMSHTFVDFECGGEVINWDFTTQDSYKPVFRVGQIQVEPNVWAMFAANGEQLTSIQAINSPDRTTWKVWQNFLGYSPGDYNMDVSTNSQDENIWKENQNRTTGVIFY
jgi:hypothetical protein